MKHDLKEGFIDTQVSIVVDEAEFSELVQKLIDPRTARTDHLRESFLTDMPENRSRLILGAEIGEHQEDAGQPFLAGIEELIDQVFFDPLGPLDQERHETIREFPIVTQQPENELSVEPDDRCGTDGHRIAEALATIGYEAVFTVVAPERPDTVMG